MYSSALAFRMGKYNAPPICLDFYNKLRAVQRWGDGGGNCYIYIYIYICVGSEDVRKRGVHVDHKDLESFLERGRDIFGTEARAVEIVGLGIFFFVVMCIGEVVTEVLLEVTGRSRLRHS